MRGEDAVAAWYESQGYQIVARNWRCREGELDLIVRDGRTFVFCEVKARTSTVFGAPGEPVNAPVVFASTYRAGGDVAYARDGNASWEPFEEILGGLEGGRALAFASGLAAASAVIETLPAGAVVVAPDDAYNGTR